ncbi:MAG: dihydrofolate reductase [Nitratireductor sp.]|nr:dihydrofolate reductase [Nitratireductor sp.]
MEIALVVAVAENGVIGADGGLPWRLPSDLKRFKAVTMGKPVIMGRKTWQSIGKPLPGRANIVVTRDGGFQADGADVTTSLDDAITLATVRARCSAGLGEICIIGGGRIYAEAMELADRLHVTHVKAAPEGDTFFPEIDPAEWTAVSSEEIEAGERDSAAMRYVVYERNRA